MMRSMAVKRPSFLKKLKEQQRRARADEKREARRARKLAKATKKDEEGSEQDLPLDVALEDAPGEAETETEPQ